MTQPTGPGTAASGLKRAVMPSERARDAIRDLIQGRDYAPGDRIPSERDLSERLDVHRMTVRKAIDALVVSGDLERRGTAGTYLPAPVVRRPLAGYMAANSISEIIQSSGGTAGSKLLFFENSKADHHVAARLNVPPASDTFVIKRLRMVDDLPFCIEITTVPAHRVPGLAADDLTGDSSFYKLLQERYDIRIASSAGEIGVARLGPSDADILGLKQGEAALATHLVVRDTDDIPIEYVTSLNHPRRVTLTASFK